MLKNIPKIELHLHLDGSLDIDFIKEKYGLSNEDIKNKMIADEKCIDLNDYLTKFDYPLSIMQTKEELINSTKNLISKLISQNVKYAEIRFAPQLHTRKKLTQDEVVKTVIDASKNDDIKINFILCFMRGNNNEKDNLETLEVAYKYLNKGVCAVDLAGAEALYPTKNYEELFKRVNEYHIPFTIHAGEADGIESIKAAIKFGAKRIGHGVRVIDDISLVKYLVDNDITLEICPTSNIQTCICNSYHNHPLRDLYKMGVKTTINTDNMTVSNTCLLNEYEHILEETDLTEEDIINMNINAINAAFISTEEKIELFKLY